MSRLIYYLLLIYFSMIPFDGVVAYISSKSGIRLFLGWDIILIVILIYLIAILFLRKGSVSRKALTSTSDILTLMIYCLFIPTLIGFYFNGIWQTLLGLKIVLIIPLILYFLFLTNPYLFRNTVEKIMQIYSLLYPFIFIVGFIERLLGVNYMNKLISSLSGDHLLKFSTVGGTIFRSIATFRGPYDFGFFSFLVSVFAFCLFMQPQKKKKWSVIVFSLGIIGIFLSASRTNAIAIIYSFFIFLFFFKLKCKKNTTTYALYSISIFMLFVVFLHFISAHNTFNSPFLSSRSLHDRYLLWAIALKKTLSNKLYLWFLGRGIGSLGGAQIKFNPQSYNPVDNIYVYFTGTIGLVGLILFIWVAFKSVLRAVKTADTSDVMQMYSVVLISSMLFVQGFFVSFMEGPLSGAIFWMAVIYLRCDYLSFPQRINGNY